MSDPKPTDRTFLFMGEVEERLDRGRIYDGTEPDLIARITAAVRLADQRFESSGGSSRHWVQECFLPTFDESGLAVVDRRASEMTENHRASAERDVTSLANKLDDAERLNADLLAALTACRRQMQNDYYDKPRIGMEAECALADAAIKKATGK